MGYAAFEIDEPSRTRLLSVYKPKHEKVIAHHVTLKFGISEQEFQDACNFFNNTTHCSVRGYADFGGVDCVGVIVEGWGSQLGAFTTPLHITLSCAEGVKPVMAKYSAQKVMEVNGYMVLSGTIKYFN